MNWAFAAVISQLYGKNILNSLLLETEIAVVYFLISICVIFISVKI